MLICLDCEGGLTTTTGADIDCTTRFVAAGKAAGKAAGNVDDIAGEAAGEADGAGTDEAVGAVLLPHLECGRVCNTDWHRFSTAGEATGRVILDAASGESTSSVAPNLDCGRICDTDRTPQISSTCIADGAGTDELAGKLARNALLGVLNFALSLGLCDKRCTNRFSAVGEAAGEATGKVSRKAVGGLPRGLLSSTVAPSLEDCRACGAKRTHRF